MNIGYFSVFAGLVTAAFSFLAFYLGVKNKNSELLRNAERSAYLSALFTFLASFILIYYFLTDNFKVEYVASYSSRALPAFYKFTAFWAGSDGSLLLWAAILAGYSVAFLRLERKDALTALSMAGIMGVQTFFLLLLSTVANPFEELDFFPQDGLGLNPLLQTPEMVAHPPTLFMGYAGAAVVFSLAIAGVYLAEDRWVIRGRKWIVFTWIWLTQGIFWGAIWAYKVLGWGGYWAWDPVENSSLLPWLTLSALMHSIMIQEARRAMKLWNILLAFATFEFVILGTFITRSGVISSVHAFGQSGLTAPFVSFMLAVLVLTLWLIYEKRGYIKSEDVVESPVSKEATFLFNNLILVASAMTVFWGTIFPLVSEGLTGYKVTIGPPFYNQVITPLAIALMILLGLCIAFPWRKSAGKDLAKKLKVPFLAFLIALSASLALKLKIEMALALAIFFFSLTTHIQQYIQDTIAFSSEYKSKSYLKVILRRRRRYGGYTVHLGLLLVFVGVAGSVYDQTFENVKLELNQPKNFGEYTLVYRGLKFEDTPLKTVWTAQVEVWKGDTLLTVLTPGIEEYKTRGREEIRRVDIYSEPLKDLYLIFNGGGKDYIFLEVKINPLVNLIWLGCWIMTFGGIFALIPRSLVSKYVFSERGVAA